MALQPTILTPATTLVSFLSEAMILAGVTKRALITMSGFESFLSIFRAKIGPHETALREALHRLSVGVQFSKVYSDKEVNSGFRTISTHNAIETWASIETTIEQTLIQLIECVDDADDRIRSAVGDSRKLDKATRQSSSRDVLRVLEKSMISTDVTDRTIDMLAIFGVHVSLPQAKRQRLSELAELRNVVLHNDGLIDKRFLEKCPWHTAPLNSKLVITTKLMEQYFDAAGDFATALVGALVQALKVPTETKT